MADIIPQFKVVKANNVWVMQNPDALAKYKLDAKDGDYFLSIAPPKNQSLSIRQLGYYWGVIIELYGDHLGYDKYEMDAVFNKKFLYRDFLHEGEIVVYYRRLSSLNVKEMSSYLDLCIKECAEGGVVIPDPDEVVLTNRKGISDG